MTGPTITTEDAKERLLTWAAESDAQAATPGQTAGRLLAKLALAGLVARILLPPRSSVGRGALGAVLRTGSLLLPVVLRA